MKKNVSILDTFCDCEELKILRSRYYKSWHEAKGCDPKVMPFLHG